METPSVSVITPAYNAARFIRETIRSVQAQSFTGWEMIIIDDRSTDDTVRIVEEEAGKDSRIRLIMMDKNSHQAAARNAGIRRARGRYIAFLDSDDLWLPEKLETQVNFMRGKGSVMSFTGYRCMSMDGRYVGRGIKVPMSVGYKDLLRGNRIGCLTLMVDRRGIEDLEFPSGFEREDYALWLTLLKRIGKADGIDRDLARYRMVKHSHSNNKLWSAWHTYKIYRDSERLPFHKSCWYFFNYSYNGFAKSLKFLFKEKWSNQFLFSLGGNKETPLVTVITPAYNLQAYIKKTIETVQAQTYKNWEMIVIDDCSTDRTPEIVEEMAKADPRVRLIRMEKNSKQAAARNRGMKEARGKYIAFLDGDDMWLPGKLERQVRFMLSSGAPFSYTGYRHISRNEDWLGKFIKVPESLDYRGQLKNTGIIGCLTVMVDTEKTGPFQFKSMPREDLELWVSLFKRGLTAYGINEDLARYRITKVSVKKRAWAAYQNWKFFRKIEKLSLPFACWCFIRYSWNSIWRHSEVLGNLSIKRGA